MGSEFDQHSRTPFLHNPVRSFEIRLTGNAADGAEVLGREKEWVRELVFVGEEVRWECEIGVQGTGGGWWDHGLGRKREAEGWVESCGFGEGREVGSAAGGGGEMVSGREREKGGTYCWASVREVTGRPTREEVLGLVSSPITVRKPPTESCPGSVGFSFASTPTSTLAEPPTF